ncbi:hypothetical protein A4X09_0g2280 [Tilletia walkeri]|uniref:Amino acid transporter transmembrane domain-containing protein n=1 Tax=Tilletia walkeri TaxID=117179 RepID=A0A8X7NBP0_9BASI|nr:hypothetical protein A4X09_0g2280 [Tilletia walkeri]
MAPRTSARQAQGIPVNAAQGGAGGGAGGRGAAAAAAARDQNPPWRSSLDLVWSYSRSQAFYGDNIGTSPSFADRRWAGPHRASIAEEDDDHEADPADGDEYEDEDDDEDADYEDYSEYDDEGGQDGDEEDYDDRYEYEEEEEEEEVDPAEARDAVPSTSTAGIPQPPSARRRPLPPRTDQAGYYSSDDERDHLGRRRSKIPNSRSQVRAVLAQQQEQQHRPFGGADSSAVDSSDVVSGTDQSITSDAGPTGAAGAEPDWDGEQLPPNAIQRSVLSPPTSARRRRRSKNPPSAYRGPRSSYGGTGTDEAPSPIRGLGLRKRSSDRNSIDSDFSTQRPTRPQRTGGSYGAVSVQQDNLDPSGRPIKGNGTAPGAPPGESSPLLGPTGGRTKSDPTDGISDLRRLSRISTNRTISAFSTSVKTDRFIASQGTSTFLQSWFNTLNALIGVGVLALPLAFALTGPILGPILFLLAGLLTNYTGKVLARIMARNPQLRTYADIGTFAFGPSARWMVTALFCLELWAVSTALIILFGDSVFAIAGRGSPALWKAVGFLIILPTIFLPLKFLSPISVVGIISTITLFVVVLADGLIKKEAPGSLWEPRIDRLGPQWSRLPLSFGLIMSGFSSHPVIPSLFKDMQQPHRFPQMLDRAYIVATVIYLGMGMAGYFMFGSDVTDEITRDLSRIKEYPRVLNHMAIWLIIINPLAKFALAARPITTTAELIFGVEKSQTHIQEALARQLQLAREEEEAFMAGEAGAGAGAGGAGAGAAVPARRYSGALSAVRRAELNKRSADVPAIREERRPSNPLEVQTSGGAGKLRDAEGDMDTAKTPTQAALFSSGNPFSANRDSLDGEEGAIAKNGGVSGRGENTADSGARQTRPDRSSTDPSAAITAARVAARAPLSPPLNGRVDLPAEILMERALNEAGLDASEMNPLAASAFSMRVAKMTAARSARFKVWARVAVKVIITVLITLTAIAIPGFEKVMAFLGAFLAFTSCVFGPLIAHLRIFHRSMPRWRIALDIGILAVSLVAAALGTVWSFLPR